VIEVSHRRSPDDEGSQDVGRQMTWPVGRVSCPNLWGTKIFVNLKEL
jgi:hypothetical protein